MARADTLTWLPLDRWAEIMGFDPLHFNGVTTSLRPDSACNKGEDIWLQAAWQDASKISREDLAEAIREAETILSSYVGYSLLPGWTIDERANTVRPAFRELYSAGANVRWLGKSIQAQRGYALSGGQRAKTVISAGAAIVRSDSDADGYNDLCTVTVASTVDPEEVRVYFTGLSGADEWEIRPVKVITSGANLVITFKIWQVPNPNLWQALNATGIDGDQAGNFQTTVDIYRVYNDPQSQVQFLWEPDGWNGLCASCGGSGCAACQFASQNGCLHIRDARLGTLVYSPADWNAATSQFDASDLAICRDPDRLRLWYYSGWRWESGDARKRATVDLDPYWEKAIAYFATALLERDVCACNNVEKFLDYYREDLSRNNADWSYQTVPEMVANEFGTRRGAWYAWKRANAEGRRIQP